MTTASSRIGVLLGRIALLGASAIALLAIAVPSAFAAPAWLPTEDISPEGAGFLPQIAIDAAGDTAAIWEGPGPSNESIIETASRPAGRSWPTKAIPLSAPGQNAMNPQIAVNAAGAAVAVWSRTENGTDFVEAASRPAGGAWSTKSVKLSPSNRNATFPQVAIDAAGNAVAIWRGLAANGNSFIEASSRPASGSWSTLATPISAPGQEAGQAQVAIDPAGEAVAVWTAFVPNGIATIETASRSPDGTWSALPATKLSGPSVGLGSHVAIDGAGEAVAIWLTANPDLFIAIASRLPDGNWLGGPTGALGSEPEVAIDPAGDAVAVWRGPDASVETASRPVGGSWSTRATPLSAPGHHANDPQVAIDPAGDAVAVWQVRSASNDFIVEAASRTAGADWSFSTPRSSPLPSEPAPQVAMDAVGDAVAIWNHTGDGKNLAEAAAFDATPPQLRSLSIPNTATAGVPLSFSVAPFDAFSSQVSTQWSFGDGTQPSPGTTITHTYVAPGTYKLTLTATDQVGNSTSSAATITVAPGHPKAIAARTGKLRRSKALLKLSCPIIGPCQGTVKLSAKHGAKGRLTLGKRSFQIDAGKSLTLAIKLTPAARRLIAASSRKGFVAKLAGSGVEAATVRLRG
jgi:hypothetical protein